MVCKKCFICRKQITSKMIERDEVFSTIWNEERIYVHCLKLGDKCFMEWMKFSGRVIQNFLYKMKL